MSREILGGIPARPTVTQKPTSKIIELPSFWRRAMMIAWDGLFWVLAVLVFVVIRYDLSLNAAQRSWALLYTATAIILKSALGLVAHVYLGHSRVGSFSETTWIGTVVLLTSIPLGLALSVMTPRLPRGVALISPPLALAFMTAGRWLFRIALASVQPRRDEGAIKAIVYGAGEAGHQVAMLDDKAEEPPYSIVGFVDEDPDKRFLRVRGYRVLGTGKEMIDEARERQAGMVILANSTPPPHLIQTVAHQCNEAGGLDFVVIPPVRGMIGGQISLAALRHFSVEDLLGRRAIKTDLSAIAEYLTGKVILVTDAGGSIGFELARQLHKLGPSKLVLLDRDESALHAVQLDLYGNGLLDTDNLILCDIRDDEALCAVFKHHKRDLVFHAAAPKHFPMLERYPDEGWETNVVGSLNVMSCAHEAGVKHFVNISTDKAADASSVLGRPKRLAERLTARLAGHHGVRSVSVRFGNILGSRGSVLHSFKAQIERGGSVTVTHLEVTRYFMTIPEACELVLQAGAVGKAGDVLVLDMGEPVRTVDVAECLIAESGSDVEINFAVLQRGEKPHEVLFGDSEDHTASSHPLISQVPRPRLSPNSVTVLANKLPDATRLAPIPRDSRVSRNARGTYSASELESEVVR